MGKYLPISDRAKALHGEELFEVDFTPLEERDQLDGGHLAIVPRPYRVLVDNLAAGKQGDVVSLALLVEAEGALLAGGFLERSDSPNKKTANK